MINDDSLIDRLDNLFENQSHIPDHDQSRTKLVAQYRTLRVLGTGGFGIVYLAEDTELNRLVALKLPRFDALLDIERRKRFAAEAKMVARLNHPGIVRIYEANLDGSMPFIASEFCDGPNLADWIRETNALPPWRQSAEFVANIADAVQHAHQNGVYHRDLKPANIMLTLRQQGPVKQNTGYANWQLDKCRAQLTDFGLAKLIDSTTAETRTSQIVGTPLYMAPEQVEGDGFAIFPQAIDIYSLGVILFETLTGQVPIDGSSYLQAMKRISTVPASKLTGFRKGLPRDLQHICSRCLQKNPEARYQSAAELAIDLRRCAQGDPIKGRRLSIGKRCVYWCTRPRRITDAGWFGIWSTLLVTSWILFNVIALPFHQSIEIGQWTAALKDFLVLIVGNVIPNIWLSWKITRGRVWALWLLTVCLIIRLPLQIRAMVAPPIYFAMIFQGNTTFSFVDHSLAVITTVILIFLCVCGILAAVKMRGSQRAADKKSTLPGDVETQMTPR